jgi:hypothetical protein
LLVAWKPKSSAIPAEPAGALPTPASRCRARSVERRLLKGLAASSGCQVVRSHPRCSPLVSSCSVNTGVVTPVTPEPIDAAGSRRVCSSSVCPPPPSACFTVRAFFWLNESSQASPSCPTTSALRFVFLRACLVTIFFAKRYYSKFRCYLTISVQS